MVKIVIGAVILGAIIFIVISLTKKCPQGDASVLCNVSKAGEDLASALKKAVAFITSHYWIILVGLAGSILFRWLGNRVASAEGGDTEPKASAEDAAGTKTTAEDDDAAEAAAAKGIPKTSPTDAPAPGEATPPVEPGGDVAYS